MRNLIMITLAAITLSACGSSHKVTYSGREESTEGVPGFVKGKKVSPNVKLGQSYSIDGDTYVPRHEPDYVEEGMASWYGPGFHGGKTANGEEFDKHAMTAAHRTLPLPSIVKVTLLSTGKSAYVRINDRGPFAHSRIIDLSYAAAKEIGMIAKGVGNVRVEYQLNASQRFADLLAQGRAPESIDLAEEVLPYNNQEPVPNQYAALEMSSISDTQTPITERNDTLLKKLNPISSAQAQEITDFRDNADSNSVESVDLPAPVAVNAPTRKRLPGMVQPRGDPPIPIRSSSTTIALAKPVASQHAQSLPSGISGNVYIQLGSFSQRSNALRLQRQTASIDSALIMPINQGNATLYRVRMGPYDVVKARSRLSELRELGILHPSLVKH